MRSQLTAICPLGHKTVIGLDSRFEDDLIVYKFLSKEEGIRCEHCEHVVMTSSIEVNPVVLS